jgi:holin-like protein
MKYIYQFGIILAVTIAGEILNNIIPLPIPASIYGLLIMLFCLMAHIIKPEKIKETSEFLLKIMPMMFIPATVGIIAIWESISMIVLPLIIITVVTTIIVMVVTGKVTEYVIIKTKDRKH